MNHSPGLRAIFQNIWPRHSCLSFASIAAVPSGPRCLQTLPPSVGISSEDRSNISSSNKIANITRDQEAWRLRSIMLECEILLLAIGNDIPKSRKNSSDIVSRAQLRGLIDTLADKVVEAKALIKLRRQENRRQLAFAEVDNKWIPFLSSEFIDFELGVLTKWIVFTPLSTWNQKKFVESYFYLLIWCRVASTS